MAHLRVIVDQLISRVPGGIGRYTEQLTRGLLTTAGPGDTVEALSAAASAAEIRALTERLPGISGVTAARLGRRELSRAWQHGVPIRLGGGSIHATSLFAPLVSHDRSPSARTVATIHDVVPWTHPQTLTPHGVAWHTAMARRAQKFADAVVVPTRAVADQLGEIFDFGDRIHIVGGAAGANLQLPNNVDERAAALALPDRYILSVGTLEPRKALGDLIEAMRNPELDDVPLLVVGPTGWGGVSVASVAGRLGLDGSRVRALGMLDDSDLALAYSRASVFAFPSLAEGFGLPILEAFRFGAPVVHSDDPALVEVAGGVGLVVKRSGLEGTYSQRLAEALASVLSEPDRAARMAMQGRLRADQFSWQRSAEQVWEIHRSLTMSD